MLQCGPLPFCFEFRIKKHRMKTFIAACARTATCFAATSGFVPGRLSAAEITFPALQQEALLSLGRDRSLQIAVLQKMIAHHRPFRDVTRHDNLPAVSTALVRKASNPPSGIEQSLGGDRTPMRCPSAQSAPSKGLPFKDASRKRHLRPLLLNTAIDAAAGFF